MNGKRDYMDCSPELIGALTQLVRAALLDQFPAPRVDVTETEQLLDMLHVLRPSLSELRLFDGFAHVVRERWHDAIDAFATLVSQSLCMPGSQAMLVYCMNACENSDWRIVATQMLDDEDKLTPEARTLLDVVQVYADWNDARARAQSGGIFEVPESVKRWQEDHPRAEQGASSPTGAAARPTTASSVAVSERRLPI